MPALPPSLWGPWPAGLLAQGPIEVAPSAFVFNTQQPPEIETYALAVDDGDQSMLEVVEVTTLTSLTTLFMPLDGDEFVVDIEIPDSSPALPAPTIVEKEKEDEGKPVESPAATPESGELRRRSLGLEKRDPNPDPSILPSYQSLTSSHSHIADFWETLKGWGAAMNPARLWRGGNDAVVAAPAEVGGRFEPVTPT